MQVMQMILTVQGASQVPSLPWLSVFLNPSELFEKLKCQFQISALPAAYKSPILVRLEAWVLAMYSMSGLPQVLKAEIGFMLARVLLKLNCVTHFRAEVQILGVLFSHSSP